MFLFGLIAFLLVVAATTIGTGIHDKDWGRVSVGTFMFLMPAVVIIYFMVRPTPIPKAETATPQQDDEREAQLKALAAAVPSTPLSSMRATVQTNTYKVARAFIYSVDMILELTETERAIIKEHELDDIVLEDVSLYSKEDLQRKESDIAKHHQAFEDAFTSDKMVREKLAEQMDTNTLAMMKTARLKTTVGQLLASPYSRVFNSPHEANDYAQALKTKFLPEMKKIIDKHGAHKQTETLQF